MFFQVNSTLKNHRIRIGILTSILAAPTHETGLSSLLVVNFVG